jgi:hypothetical protein
MRCNIFTLQRAVGKVSFRRDECKLGISEKCYQVAGVTSARNVASDNALMPTDIPGVLCTDVTIVDCAHNIDPIRSLLCICLELKPRPFQSNGQSSSFAMNCMQVRH